MFGSNYIITELNLWTTKEITPITNLLEVLYLTLSVSISLYALMLLFQYVVLNDKF